MKCLYCSSPQGRCSTTSTGRSITECTSCGRVVEERQFQPHHLFHIRAQDNPLCLVTSDLPSVPHDHLHKQNGEEEDPFEPTGFITAFSTWSLEPTPLSLRSSISFSGHLAELERVLELTTAANNSNSSTVVIDNLRAYMQIIDVASILGLDSDISDHAFQLFRDCCSATCLRNRSVEALATAALVQAIREAQEPRTLQELATHIGEVVINKCFCTRRNPISISAAAIYLACQLEDKRKTQAEICKVTGLTEVTLRKVYKELLENWDDLLPSNYTPAVPPEKAFPTTTFTSGRSAGPRAEPSDLMSSDKQGENTGGIKPNDAVPRGGKEANEVNGSSQGVPNPSWHTFRQPWVHFATQGEKGQSTASRGDSIASQSSRMEVDEKDKHKMEMDISAGVRGNHFTTTPMSSMSTITWPFRATTSTVSSLIVQPPPKLAPGFAELKAVGNHKGGKSTTGGDGKWHI
ncbi:Plant-specific TFIIB-related protein 1 [Linum perenne]